MRALLTGSREAPCFSCGSPPASPGERSPARVLSHPSGRAGRLHPSPFRQGGPGSRTARRLRLQFITGLHFDWRCNSDWCSSSPDAAFTKAMRFYFPCWPRIYFAEAGYYELPQNLIRYSNSAARYTQTGRSAGRTRGVLFSYFRTRWQRGITAERY